MNPNYHSDGDDIPTQLNSTHSTKEYKLSLTAGAAKLLNSIHHARLLLLPAPNEKQVSRYGLG